MPYSIAIATESDQAEPIHGRSDGWNNTRYLTWQLKWKLSEKKNHAFGSSFLVCKIFAMVTKFLILQCNIIQLFSSGIWAVAIKWNFILARI